MGEYQSDTVGARGDRPRAAWVVTPGYARLCARRRIREGDCDAPGPCWDPGSRLGAGNCLGVERLVSARSQ